MTNTLRYDIEGENTLYEPEQKHVCFEPGERRNFLFTVRKTVKVEEPIEVLVRLFHRNIAICVRDVNAEDGQMINVPGRIGELVNGKTLL